MLSGDKSNIVLFSLTRNDVSGLQTAPGGGGKAGITQFSGMTITSYFILVADIFRLEENANIWQTTFSNGFPEWNGFHVDSKKIYFRVFNWQVNNSLGKGLSPIGYQAITWINVD